MLQMFAGLPLPVQLALVVTLCLLMGEAIIRLRPRTASRLFVVWIVVAGLVVMSVARSGAG